METRRAAEQERVEAEQRRAEAELRRAEAEERWRATAWEREIDALGRAGARCVHGAHPHPLRRRAAHGAWGREPAVYAGRAGRPRSSLGLAILVAMLAGCS